MLPLGRFDASLHTRVAGVGSLGSRRIVAIGEMSGGLVVREAKQIPGPASMWVYGRRPARDLTVLVARAQAVAADPSRIQRGKWVVRRLAPDMTRLEITALRRKHDEGAILRSMGAAAANVHLVPHKLAAPAKAVRKDEAARPAAWLADAAQTMVQLTLADHRAWCAGSGRGVDHAPRAQPGQPGKRRQGQHKQAGSGVDRHDVAG